MTKKIIAEFDIEFDETLIPADQVVKLFGDYISINRFTKSVTKVEAYPPHLITHTFVQPKVSDQ